ncbi:MAG: E2/UBC family protein [Candidatus Thermoplasmatota archaeon]|jgi:hypothetical protein
MPEGNPPVTVDNDVLKQEIEALKASHRVEVIGFDGNFYGILLRDYPVPAGKFLFTATPDSAVAEGTPADRVDILLRIQKLYPHAAPDMFWNRPFLKLASGGVPQASEQREDYFGLKWQRFSWHLKSGWTPIQDTLDDFIAFVDRRLQQGD